MSTDGIAISKLFYNATLGVILETNKFGIEYPQVKPTTPSTRPS